MTAKTKIKDIGKKIEDVILVQNEKAIVLTVKKDYKNPKLNEDIEIDHQDQDQVFRTEINVENLEGTGSKKPIYHRKFDTNSTFLMDDLEPFNVNGSLGVISSKGNAQLLEKASQELNKDLIL